MTCVLVVSKDIDLRATLSGRGTAETWLVYEVLGGEAGCAEVGCRDGGL